MYVLPKKQLNFYGPVIKIVHTTSQTCELKRVRVPFLFGILVAASLNVHQFTQKNKKSELRENA